MSSKELSAADLIKRFREGKPMSAEERRSSIGDRAKMWWEDTSHTVGAGVGSGSMGRSLTDTYEESPVPRGRSQLISPENSIRGGRSRSPSLARRSGVGASGVRNRERELDFTEDDDLDNFMGQSHRSLGESREHALRRSKMSVMDEVDDPLYKSRTFGRSLDVDALIGNELQRLKEDVRKKEQATLRRLNSGSYGPIANSRGSGDFGRQSTETLGSTGFLGLLKPDLRLDSAPPKKPVEEEKAAVPQPDPLSTEELNKKLEIILADLKKNVPPEPPKKTYLPEGVEETIPQITDKLTQDMKQLTAVFNYEEQDAAAKEKAKAQKEYEDKLRAEGREEEKKKRLIDALDTPVYEPKDLLTVWKSASYPTDPRVVNVPSSSSGARRRETQERDPLGDSAEEAEALHRLRAKRHDSALVMQRAIDNELTSAEQIFHQMRHLRTNLGLRMHQVHAMGNATVADLGTNGGSGSGHRGGAEMREPLGSMYWGLEEHKEELEIRNFQGDIRKTFNPYPNLVHENIFKVTQAVESTLNVAMDILMKRLGHEDSPAVKPAIPVAPTPKPTTAPVDEVMSSLEFELSTSLPPSPARDAAKRFVGDLLAAANKKEEKPPTPVAVPEPKQVDVKAELANIDKVLGEDENITFAKSKALSAGRFDRFLSSKQTGEILFGDGSPTKSNPIIIDPLRDVRQERKIFVGPPAIFNDEASNQDAPSAPPAPLTKPPSSLNVYSKYPLPYTSALTSSSSKPSLNMRPEDMHLPRRPLEGTAISYYKSQQYESGSSSTYAPPRMDNFNERHKISSAVTTPSAAASILEREEFLQKMRNMREKIQTKH